MYLSDTTKYLIHIKIEAEGVVEKTDVVGAIFGQTEGLLGEDMDLRDLQRSGRVGRIDVTLTSKHGKTAGDLTAGGAELRVVRDVGAAFGAIGHGMVSSQIYSGMPVSMVSV